MIVKSEKLVSGAARVAGAGRSLRGWRGWKLACAMMIVVLPAAAGSPSISGDYLEARTADIYTGPCFANSEMNLVGKEAVFAWWVERGAWLGVPVDGLSVLAAVRASATLGDPFADPLPSRSLLVVDERATPEQRTALVAFVHSMAGDLLGRVVGTVVAPIELALDQATAGEPPIAADLHHEHVAGGGGSSLSGQASLRAGDLVELRTRGLDHGDHLCGNEEVYYPPLNPATEAVPAATLVYDFRAPGLGMTWSSPGKRSAFVGHFAR